MKLVLCSEGFYTPNTVQACVELCGKPQDEITVAIINEAYAVEPGDKYWVLDNLNDVAKNFRAGIDLVNLLALPIDEVEKRIAARDVIFTVGGNADYLMHVFQKTGFDTLLPGLLETKVYVGSSGGSRVVGKKVNNDEFNKIFGNKDMFEVTEYLGLVDLSVIPHINSAEFPERTSEALQKTSSGTPFPVYGLQDDSAIVIDGDEQRFIGSTPYKVT
jgi:dipeptidase E